MTAARILRDFADVIDRGPAVPLPPSVYSALAREHAEQIEEAHAEPEGDVVEGLAEYIADRLTTELAHLGRPIARYVLGSGLVVPVARADEQARRAVTRYAERERPVVRIETAGEAEAIVANVFETSRHAIDTTKRVTPVIEEFVSAADEGFPGWGVSDVDAMARRLVSALTPPPAAPATRED